MAVISCSAPIGVHLSAVEPRRLGRGIEHNALSQFTFIGALMREKVGNVTLNDEAIDNIRSLATTIDCDRAMFQLSEEIADIESWIGDAVGRRNRTGAIGDRKEFHDARYLLKVKRLALTLIQERRGDLRRIEQQRQREHDLIELLKEIDPDAAARLFAEAKRRWPKKKQREPSERGSVGEGS